MKDSQVPDHTILSRCCNAPIENWQGDIVCNKCFASTREDDNCWLFPGNVLTVNIIKEQEKNGSL